MSSLTTVSESGRGATKLLVQLLPGSARIAETPVDKEPGEEKTRYLLFSSSPEKVCPLMLSFLEMRK